MKPFLSGRQHASGPALKNLDGQLPKQPGVRIAGHSHGAAPAASTPDSEPTVECIRQGDKITRIVVTCGCGERIEIDCLYPAGG